MAFNIGCPFYAYGADAQVQKTKKQHINCEGLGNVEKYRRLQFLDKIEKANHIKSNCNKTWEQCTHAQKLLEQYDKK